MSGLLQGPIDTWMHDQDSRYRSLSLCIRNLAEFAAMYLRVLDLQEAFSHMYIPIAATVF